MPGVESPEGFFIRMDGAWAGGLDSRVQLEYPHVVSPCSLGFLTIWWPQGRPVDKGEAGWLFMTWPQTPFSITPATPYWSKQSQGRPDSEKAETLLSDHRRVKEFAAMF